jgi:hypothetical protein
MNMGKYLDILVQQHGDYDINDQNDKIPSPSDRDTQFGRFGRFGRKSAGYCQRAFEALERRCPEWIDLDSWQQAVEDGRCFLSQWGEKAQALGWTVKDLFGLAPVPDKPAPSYRRLSRYDGTGLVRLLRGRAVVALTGSTAAIENPTGAITIYRKNNKPALGPVGDGLDDIDPSGWADHGR